MAVYFGSTFAGATLVEGAVRAALIGASQRRGADGIVTDLGEILT